MCVCVCVCVCFPMLISIGTKFKIKHFFNQKVLGPVIQSIVSLTSSLVVKMLAVLVSKISNSQVFLLKKCE